MAEKKPATVIAAEIALEVKAKELTEAREAVKRLERERGEAIAAVRATQTEADASLPRCRMVTLHRHTGKETSAEPVVILRRTPGGMQWAAHGEKFVQAEKTSFYSNSRELRDVPPEYMPGDGNG